MFDCEYHNQQILTLTRSPFELPFPNLCFTFLFSQERGQFKNMKFSRKFHTVYRLKLLAVSALCVC